jgi:GNAT superfamily N-acetyltransferase
MIGTETHAKRHMPENVRKSEGMWHMEHLALTEQLEDYEGYFPGAHLELVRASITAGNTAAHLWIVSQVDGAPLLLLWDKGNNVFYLAGECQASLPYPQLAAIVTTQIRPQALAEGKPHFKVRALSAPLEQALSYIFCDVTLHQYPMLFYVHDTEPPRPKIAPPTLADVRIISLTREVLRQRGLAHSDDVRAEIRWMWPSEDRFFTHGFGTLAIMHDQIICWCTAEYVSPQFCGIGIATLPPFERRGVATATAAHFVQQARQRGLTACWECGRDNHGSVRVAEKLGFVRQAEERYWIGSFIA